MIDVHEARKLVQKSATNIDRYIGYIDNKIELKAKEGREELNLTLLFNQLEVPHFMRSMILQHYLDKEFSTYYSETGAITFLFLTWAVLGDL